MNKDKYIKLVMKNLKCSHQQKRKIKIDLENDIAIAIKEGKSFEDIMKRMGSPIEVANEFNENLGVADKKSHKKLIIGIVVGVVGLLVIGILYVRSLIPETYPLGTSGLFQKEEVEKNNTKVAELIGNDDFQGLIDMSSPELQEKLPVSKLKEGKKSLGELGKFQRLTSEYHSEVKQNSQMMVVSEVVALYEKRSVTYRLTFDEQGVLIGIYMK